MHPTAQEFVDQIRDDPRFIAARRVDPIWDKHLALIEYGLRGISEDANTSTLWLARLDELIALIRRDDLTMGPKLFAVVDLLRPWRELKH